MSEFLSVREPLLQIKRICTKALCHIEDNYTPEQIIKAAKDLKDITSILLACDKRNFMNANAVDFERMPVEELIAKLPQQVAVLRKFHQGPMPPERTPEQIEAYHERQYKKALKEGKLDE